ncbi:MAG: hypothetical protein ACP5QU_02790 [Anaerolineae bacterium]
MKLEDAIQQMQSKILAISPAATIKVARISAEEARLSVYAPAEEMQAIKEATFQPALDFLNNEGLDVQVFVYDSASASA